jgi:surface antigen
MVWIRVLGAAALIAVSGVAQAQILDSPEAMAMADAKLRIAAEPRAYSAPIGSVLSWSNPVTGSRGIIVPVSEGETEYGLCRDLEETVTADGGVIHGVTTGCRQGDSSWKTIRTTLAISPYAADVPADLPSGAAAQPLPFLRYDVGKPAQTKTTKTTP